MSNENDDALPDQTRRLIKREVQRILNDEDGGYLSVSTFNQYQQANNRRLTSIDESIANLNIKLTPVLNAQEQVLLIVGQAEQDKEERAKQKAKTEAEIMVRAEARAEEESRRLKRNSTASFILVVLSILIIITGAIATWVKYVVPHTP